MCPNIAYDMLFSHYVKKFRLLLEGSDSPSAPLPVLLKAKRIPGRTEKGCDGFLEIGLMWKNMKTTFVRNWKKGFYCPVVLLCL